MAEDNLKKSWYKSVTIQANLASFLGAASAYASGTMSKEVALTAMVMAVLNTVLRVKTKNPIK